VAIASEPIFEDTRYVRLTRYGYWPRQVNIQICKKICNGMVPSNYNKRFKILKDIAWKDLKEHKLARCTTKFCWFGECIECGT
jgi:hypothetical protein